MYFLASVRVDGLAPSAAGVNKKSVRASWYDVRALGSTISSVSRAFSAASSCPPARNCTCSTKTDSFARTTISASSKVDTELFLRTVCRCHTGFFGHISF